MSKIPSAAAYTSVGEAEGGTVKVLTIGGIAPTAATLRDKSYPISRVPTLATKGEAAGEEKAFIDFALSAKGQAVVTKEGLVSIQ